MIHLIAGWLLVATALLWLSSVLTGVYQFTRRYDDGPSGWAWNGMAAALVPLVLSCILMVADLVLSRF